MRQKFKLKDTLDLLNPHEHWLEINNGNIVVQTSNKLKFMIGWNISDVDVHCKKFSWKLEKF